MRRPTSIDAMTEALGRFQSDEGQARGLAFQPKPSDVIISPYAKCGTTWMQQIVHGLRSGGDMGFDEITAVTPWIEMAHDIGFDLEASQPGDLRAFKSHLPWDIIPKGGRYIIVLRDPVDAMVSLFKFFEGWFFETGSVSVDAFARYYLDERDGRDYWHHAASWWDVRGRGDVLILTYEAMRQDLPRAVNDVAAFIGVSDAQTIAVAETQARFDFMKAHEVQFDDHLTRQARDAMCGLPPGSVVTKVSEGKAGAGKPMLGAEAHDAFAMRWRETMGARFGVDDYAALRALLEPASGGLGVKDKP